MSSPRVNVAKVAMGNRREALDELATSESRYLKKLRAIVNAYMTPLREGRLLTAGEMSTIFRGMSDMRDVHSKLNGVIQTASEDDNVTKGVAIAANEFVLAKPAILELYVPFARAHATALRTLRNAMARPDVSRAITNIASTDERVRGSSLEDLLCLPLDRIGEYKNILSELLSLSQPADRGYAALQDTVDLLSAILKEAGINGYTPFSAGNGVSANVSSDPFSATMSNAALVRASSPNRAVSTSTSAVLAASRPAQGSPLPTLGDLQRAESAAISQASSLLPGLAGTSSLSLGVSPEAVVAAQAEAEDAARRLEALDREVSLKESELSLTQKEVARAEGKDKDDNMHPGAMEDALKKLQDEERELLQRIMTSPETRGLFEAFLTRKRELDEEEARLTQALAEHEDTLAQVRSRLANPPASVLPQDPAKASLYLAWKRALAEREELLRQARRRKHELLRDLKARHETQVVLLEMERRAAVDGLREQVTAEKAKVEAYKKDLSALDESIEQARSAMKKFRQEFEQLRVALLIDRMAKSSQVANLADRRRRLAREAEQFQEAVEAAKARVASEEAAKWESRLAAEKEAGERKVEEEKKLIEAKIERVRAALAERYEAGFKPLLKEAEARHLEELQRIVDLQKDLENKEKELRQAHEAARAVSAAVANITSNSEENENKNTDGDVPDWKLREFEDLKNAVATMWEQLDVPPEDVTAFLSECDLLAPYHPRVLAMYQDMYKRLTNAAAAAQAVALAQQEATNATMVHSPSTIPAPSSVSYRPQQATQYITESSSPIRTNTYPQSPNSNDVDSIAATQAQIAQAQAVLAQQQMALASQANAAASAAARARAAATAFPAGVASSSNNTSNAAPQVVESATPAASGNGSRARSGSRGSPSASGGFRSTLFSPKKSDDADLAYLQRQAARMALPPSLGGPGSRGRKM